MEFLLLLSAMLTALTGAITGVRVPEVRVQHVVARAAEASVEVAQATVKSAVPVVDTRPVFIAIHLAAAPSPSVPLYADRLRE